MAGRSHMEFFYDRDRSELTVIFKDGQQHIYSGVSIDTWQRAREAPSKGTFFNDFIRDKYAYR